MPTFKYQGKAIIVVARGELPQMLVVDEAVKLLANLAVCLPDDSAIKREETLSSMQILIADIRAAMGAVDALPPFPGIGAPIAEAVLAPVTVLSPAPLTAASPGIPVAQTIKLERNTKECWSCHVPMVRHDPANGVSFKCPQCGAVIVE